MKTIYGLDQKEDAGSFNFLSVIFNGHESKSDNLVINKFSPEVCKKLFNILNAAPLCLSLPISQPILYSKPSDTCMLPVAVGSAVSLDYYLSQKQNRRKFASVHQMTANHNISPFFVDIIKHLLIGLDWFHCQFTDSDFPAPICSSEPDGLFVLTKSDPPVLLITRFAAASSSLPLNKYCLDFLDKVMKTIVSSFETENEKSAFACLRDLNPLRKYLQEKPFVLNDCLALPIFWTWEEQESLIYRLFDIYEADVNTLPTRVSTDNLYQKGRSTILETPRLVMVFDNWRKTFDTDHILSRIVSPKDEGLHLDKWNYTSVTELLNFFRGYFTHFKEYCLLPNYPTCMSTKEKAIDYFNSMWPESLDVMVQFEKGWHYKNIVQLV